MTIERRTAVLVLALSAGAWLGGCEPRVKVEPPDKPITINLNIKIEHEVRVKIEKDVEELIKKDSELF